MKTKKRKPKSMVMLLVQNPVFRAFTALPMDKPKQDDMALAARIAFSNTAKGSVIEADRDTLVRMVNRCQVLAHHHCTASDLEYVLKAQDAILRADSRSARGLAWNLDGDGRTAMLYALEIHEDMLGQMTREQVIDAEITVEEMRRNGDVYDIYKPGTLA